MNRRPSTPAAEIAPTVAPPASDDLTAELRRCSALGPQDAEDARCVAELDDRVVDIVSEGLDVVTAGPRFSLTSSQRRLRRCGVTSPSLSFDKFAAMARS
nr:hypothetical protein [Neoasaia chiangmaiensis]